VPFGGGAHAEVRRVQGGKIGGGIAEKRTNALRESDRDKIDRLHVTTNGRKSTTSCIC